MNDIMFSPIPLSDLESLIEKSVSKAFQARLSDQSDNELYVSVRTAAKILSVSFVTVHDYIKQGRLVRYKIGRTTRLLKSEVLSIVQPE